MAGDESLDVAQMCNAADYGSEFEYDSENEKQRARRSDMARGEAKSKVKVAHRIEVMDEYNRDEGRKDRFHMISMDAFARHKVFINDYLRYYGGSMDVFKRDTSRDRTDHDVIREHHQFLWSEEEGTPGSWESRLAKKYYDKLFKEYCIADLSRYKENKVALRWRIEPEVVSGKGQFMCGEKKCAEMEGLRSWEVNFGYMEQGVKKNALVKVRLCPECSRRLNYHHRKREIKAKRKAAADGSTGGAKRLKTDAEESDSASSIHSADVTERTGVPEGGASGAGGLQTGSEGAAEAAAAGSGGVWARPATVGEEVSREDEFDEYFTDMFL